MSGINKIITLKEGASPEQLEQAKKDVQSKGGKVTHEFKLIKGFSASFPSDHVDTMKSNEHILVEEDKEVRTQ